MVPHSRSLSQASCGVWSRSIDTCHSLDFNLLSRSSTYEDVEGIDSEAVLELDKRT